VAEPQAHRAALEKRMSRAEFVFPALIFAAVAVLLVLGNSVFAYTWTAFVFPLGAGMVLCALCAAEMAAAMRARERAEPAPRAAATANAAVPFSLASFAWMFALAVFLYGFGFVAGPALYLLVCLRANGVSWGLAAGVALASLAVTWGLFIKIMGILLPVYPLFVL
jgi:hypothetical protein